MDSQQQYLLEARQMQALSFAVHIPLVCFGIAFPAMVLFAEWLLLPHRRCALPDAGPAVDAGDGGAVRRRRRSPARSCASRWACCGRTFTAKFGSVFGLAFAIEGFSFFLEAIFIGIYVYGWNRLSPRAHFASGIPIVIAGFTAR